MSNSLPRALLTILFLSLVSGPTLAEPAMQWVQRMSDAMRNLNYRGSFVYLHENQLESFQLSHIRNQKGEKERLISMNGEAREIIRDDQNLTCIWPSSQKVVVDDSRQNSYSPIFIPEDIANLEKFYQLRLAGKDRIAGMNTMVVHIDPRDNLRYGVKFWINDQNGLMMKSSLIDETGREVEQVMFTHLELLAPGDDALIDSSPPIAENFALIQNHQGEMVSGAEVDAVWQLNQLPGGFWRRSSLNRIVTGSDEMVRQMIFTDGLASLSVFIEKLSSDTHQASETHQGATSMGAVNAFIRIVEGHSVTAIGEVPAITVQQVAESVVYRPQ